MPGLLDFNVTSPAATKEYPPHHLYTAEHYEKTRFCPFPSGFVEIFNPLNRPIGEARPIEVAGLRGAFQILIGGGRRARSKITRDDARAMSSILGELHRETLSPDDRALICELALSEHARVAEGSLGVWFTPRRPLPEFLAGTAAALHGRAKQLLDALQQGEK